MLKRLTSKNIFWAALVSIIFLIFGLITLPQYGINWDTINHLPRGQAYLRYFLSGKENYKDLPVLFHDWEKPEQWYWQDPSALGVKTDQPNNAAPERSYYQLEVLNYEYFIENDGGGHPPLSDILSAAFNRVLFSKLKLVNDIDAYRVYSVVLAALLIGLIYYWISRVYGKVAGVVSAIVLASYPLFWSEAHFNNEKDIPQTVFWYFSLFSFWLAVKNKKLIWYILTGLFLGLGIGTKFNIIFIGFVILPWLLAYVLATKTKLSGLIRIGVFGSLAVFLALVIFVGSWPYLWPDPLSRVQSVIGFYKGIGTTATFNPAYLFHGINMYPGLGILFTTPLVTLALFVFGLYLLVQKIVKRKDEDNLSILFLLCFFIPLIRTSWPGANIYGGLRQIMEYIPAMAVIAGVAGGNIWEYITAKLGKNFKKLSVRYVTVGVSLLLLLAGVILPLVPYHPNENVYFNELIGGLQGAKEKDFPYWGNTFGAAYRNGVKWLNANAYKGAQVAYARELIPNFPKLWLRPDLKLHNGYRSGYLQEKEYIIALVFDDTEKTSYHDRFLDRMLIPVYEEKAGGVAVLKVWLNDAEHLRLEYKNTKALTNFKLDKKDGQVTFELPKVEKLATLETKLGLNSCTDLQWGYVAISTDGETWERLPGTMPKEDWSVPKLGFYPQKDRLLVAFAADEAKYLRINYSPAKGCFTTITQAKITVFD